MNKEKMTENFDSFNAPQFFDFSKDLHKDENVDEYFEIDHENIQLEDPSQDPLKFRYSEELPDEDGMKFYTPLKTPGHSDDDNYRNQPRRSMSVGDLKLLCDTDQVEVNKISNTVEDVSASKTKKYVPKHTSSSNLRKAGSSTSLNKDKTGPTRSSASRITRAASKENLDRLAQPKRYASAQNLSQGVTYVSMAEAVRKFQSGTPTRFRTKSRLEAGGCIMAKLGGTIPQSPALMTKGRHRPTQAISREEQERLEFQEAQKFKIRANPLNKKILQGPIKPLIPVEKKPTTVVEPFNITAVPKKVTESPRKETFEFHANPVPKLLYEPPKLKEVRKISMTKPQTPTFMKRYVREPIRRQDSQEETKQTMKPTKTTPVPFSFERRDQEIQKKKEQLVKKVIEEEKKAREFHARPAPKAILNYAKSHSVLQRSNSSNFNVNPHINIMKQKSEENLTTQFKARPPTVLYKKPFEPKKERHLIEISEFELNTEKRAKEREEFEQLKREKEEKIAMAKQLEEELRLQQEEEEVAKLRKESEYKAQPVKKYKELIIQPSGKITEPKSPKLHTDRHRNKENEEY